MKKIVFTVTNDLTYDQRMQRICGSLARNGYAVKLVGRKRASSLPLAEQPFEQKRIRCWFNTGKLFYAEYNLRLFFYLLFSKMDAVCSIDLDTILPGLWVSKIKGIPRVYDAHELFTELKEVISRPAVHRMWTRIEKYAVPKYKHAYTVSDSIAAEFQKRYAIPFQTIRNVPFRKNIRPAPGISKKILYLGAVNEARAFEQLIPAMKKVHAPLVICGDGNFMPQLKQLIAQHQLETKIELKGMLPPDQLWAEAQQCTIGVAVAEKQGLNQYLALPNKFFDYIQAGLPQVTMDYPEYRRINEKYEIALLIDNLEPETIAAALNNLLENNVLYNRLQQNCLKAREDLNWEQEEKQLLQFWQTVIHL